MAMEVREAASVANPMQNFAPSICAEQTESAKNDPHVPPPFQIQIAGAMPGASLPAGALYHPVQAEWQAFLQRLRSISPAPI
jgi:hypothetical protein